MKFESAKQNKKNPEALETNIQRHIDNLPTALQKRWADEFDAAAEAQLPELEERLRTFVEKRDRAIHTAPGTFGDLKHTTKDTERIQATLARIDEATRRADMYVGEGKTAEVYKDPQEPNVCYKTVVNFEKYEAWNSIGKEAHFLEELEDLVVEGVRTPRVISVIDLPHVKALSMEYLDADNIKILIEKKRPLPPNFDVGQFFKRVRAYVDTMHKRNIYHRDLHGGNILVGKDGTPYIIDFGQAALSINADEAYDRAGQNRIVLTSDDDYVDATEAGLRAYAAGLKTQ